MEVISLCPSETTLQALNSTTALLTAADCASSTAVKLVEAANGDALVLNATSMGVAHYVHAAELKATALNLSGNPLQSVDLSSAGSVLTQVTLSSCNLSNLAGIAFPQGARSQGFTVDLSDNSLSSIRRAVLPDHATSLSLSKNSLSALVNCSFPDSLTHLLLADNAISRMETTELPPTLKLLDLRGNPLQSVEIRATDVSIWTKATILPTISQKSCADSRAKVQTINAHRVCVISDIHFAQKKLAETSAKSTASSSSKHATLSIILGVIYAVIGLAAAVVALLIGRRVLQKRRAQRESDQINQYLDAQELTPPPEMLNSRNSSLTRSSRAFIQTSCKLPRLQSHSPHGGGFLRPFLRVLSGVKHEPTAATFPLKHLTTSDSITEEECTSAAAVLSSSMCVALELDDFKIPAESVTIGKLISRGEFSRLYFAVIHEAGTSDDRVVIANKPASRHQPFMDAICQSMTLKHPNIVTFLGFTNINEVPCALLEHMPKGNLESVLAMRPSRQSFQWFQRGDFLPKSKAEIALDVVDALVYLHSLPTKCFFRNLRAKKVLLTEDFTAKLCTFGNDKGSSQLEPPSFTSSGRGFFSSSSASSSPTATMTPNSNCCPRANSIAWMAPELLRGQQHASEQTDMYAFGVFLTELDTCELPYTLGIDDLDREQVALLVSSGCIRPSLAMDCPVPIQELIHRCLSFSPDDRPHGVEVQYVLRKLVNKSNRPCPSTEAATDEELPEPLVETVVETVVVVDTHTQTEIESGGHEVVVELHDM